MWYTSIKQIIPDDLKDQTMREFWSHVKEDDPKKCWHWNGVEKNYYPRFIINGKQAVAHRVVHELFYGVVPTNKPYVLHSCDKRSCINPNHLRCGTARDNMIDKRFNNCPLAISERDVKVVKFMKSLNYTYKEISKKFNCSVSKIRDTCLGINTYGNLPKQYNPIIREVKND